MDNHQAPFPVKPTLVPQARKYTRTFAVGEGKIFTENDQITINIPPIANTYLTKDARIYFKFNLSFYEHSFTNNSQYPAAYFDSTDVNMFNFIRKPVPMLESSGPYSFIRDIEVYDYLGNTLIEKTTRHDLLASMLSDFYLDSEVERLCPTIAENKNPLISYGGTGSLDTTYPSFPGPLVSSQVNGINLLDADKNGYMANTDATRNAEYYMYIQTPAKQSPALIKVPTWQFSINLLNFLGRGSSSFVPLHNGFKIVLKMNPSTLPVKFSLAHGGLTMPLSPNAKTQQGASISTLTIVPRVTEYSFFDINFRADLLEVTPQFDQQIDKVVRSRMSSYFLMGRCDKPTIIPGNFQSVNSYRIAMRHLYGEYTQDVSHIGFRSRTFVDGARLLYNGAVQQEYKSVDEIRNALGPEFNTLVDMNAFVEDSPEENPYGTAGYIYPFISREVKYDLVMQRSNLQGLPKWNWINFQFVNGPPWPSPNSWGTVLNPVFTRTNNQAGKFLILFDLSLNGYNQNTITGIDTTKTTITLDLQRSDIDNWPNKKFPWETDIFVDHDAIIRIEPGKHTSVSF